MFFVARRFRAVWSVGRKECSVKCEVWRKQWEVRSVKCGVWSVKCGVWSLSLECEERSVKCEVWGLECEGSSEKCGVWSVQCGVWSLKFGVRRVQCAVWGVECRGKDTAGTGCLWTIGHLFLGNFRRRLARVYVTFICTSRKRHSGTRFIGQFMARLPLQEHLDVLVLQWTSTTRGQWVRTACWNTSGQNRLALPRCTALGMHFEQTCKT